MWYWGENGRQHIGKVIVAGAAERARPEDPRLGPRRVAHRGDRHGQELRRPVARDHHDAPPADRHGGHGVAVRRAAWAVVLAALLLAGCGGGRPSTGAGGHAGGGGRRRCRGWRRARRPGRRAVGGGGAAAPAAGCRPARSSRDPSDPAIATAGATPSIRSSGLPRIARRKLVGRGANGQRRRPPGRRRHRGAAGRHDPRRRLRLRSLAGQLPGPRRAGRCGSSAAGPISSGPASTWAALADGGDLDFRYDTTRARDGDLPGGRPSRLHQRASADDFGFTAAATRSSSSTARAEAASVFAVDTYRRTCTRP